MHSARKAFRARPRSRALPLRKIILAILSALLLTLVGFLVWYITHRPFFTITSIDVSGIETIRESDIQQKAEAILAGSYFGIIPHRFTFLYPSGRLVRELKTVSRVEDVALEKKSLTELSITVTEHAAFGLWCDTGEPATCFFIDESGRAYAPAPMLSGSTITRYVTEDRVPALGSELAKPDELVRYVAFRESLETELGLRTLDVRFTADRDIVFMLSPHGEIRVTRTADISIAFAAIKAVLDSEQYAHLRTQPFEYIDTRFGNKVYVKEVPDTVSSSTESVAE